MKFTPMTLSIEALPKDGRGYPIPYFVGYKDDKPVFHLADPAKVVNCVKKNLCWICGQRMGVYKTYVVGPMSALNRISSEPPSHLACAEWAARNCPFMTSPRAKRNPSVPEAVEPHGLLQNNPGLTITWVCKGEVKVNTRDLFVLTDPSSLRWWSEGKTSTVQQIKDGIQSSYAFLKETRFPDKGWPEGVEAPDSPFHELYARLSKSFPQE